MSKIKLPDFVTFKNFNGALDLISKKELEVNKLRSVVSFKRFLDLFESNSNLKSLYLENKHVYGEYLLCAVHTTYFDGTVIYSDKQMLYSVIDILQYAEAKKVSNINNLIIGRDIASHNKLKSIFNIKKISNKSINEMVGNNIFLTESFIHSVLNNIDSLNKQVLVVSILELFKKHQNLKAINLKVNGALVGSQNSIIDVLFSDKKSSDRNIIIDKIRNIILNKKFYNTSFLSNSVFITIKKNNFVSIKNLINSIDYRGINVDDFCSILEKEILEENIKQSVVGNKFQTIKI